ncbi:MAG: PKD domain-containing protein [Alteromonadaceae bacterium]|nr:PKD domain-containing protein [Alteromonadaceae bacterium]
MTSYKSWGVLLFLFTLLPSHWVLAAQCEFSIRNEWNNGFTADIKIINDTQATIDGWNVGIEFMDGSAIGSTWNADVSGSNPYQATNKNYNGKIQPGSQKSFGFNGTKANNGESVQPPILSGICAGGDVEISPVAYISASTTSGKAPLTINFIGDRSSSTTDQLTYLWRFTEQDTSTEANPSFTFESPGQYNVSLVVNDGATNAEEVSLNITVEEPEPEFAQCVFSIENEWNSGFTGKVTISNTAAQAISSWRVLMQFADNTTLSGTWHSTYSGNNPYEVVNENYNGYIAPNSSVDFGFNAQKAVANEPVTIPALGGICSTDGNINNPPVAVASASVTSGEAPLSVSFNGTESSDFNGDELTYQWNFGDGNVSNEVAPTHIYDTAGIFQASLTVNDGTLTDVSNSITITVSEPEVREPFVLDTTRSSLYFVSTKKTHVVETHTFTELSGDISKNGDASLRINLDSVETGIDTRNGRMTEHLFVTSVFPQSEVLLAVDYNQLKSMASGSTATQSISAMLNLHGVSVQIDTVVAISKLDAKTILVQNAEPILLNSQDFGLEAGIETLKSLAGLDVISYAVPVNFNLFYVTQ